MLSSYYSTRIKSILLALYNVYAYAKIWIKVVSTHTFSAFKISYVWSQNEIGYHIFREISAKLTINIYI